MSKVLVTEQYLEDIADAIRAKRDVETLYRPGDMADGIMGIRTASEVVMVVKNVTENGVYYPADDDAEGYSSVFVNVTGSTGGTPDGYSFVDGELHIWGMSSTSNGGWFYAENSAAEDTTYVIPAVSSTYTYEMLYNVTASEDQS